MYEGIIFDLDGTLVDSLTDIADSVNRVLVAEGFPPHPREDFKHMVGNGMRVLVTRVLPPAYRNDSIIDRIRGLVETDYDAHFLDTTRPYPGMIETLDEVKHRDLHCAVLSNKPDEFTGRIVQALFHPGCFDLVWGQSSGYPPKPNPESALAIARRWEMDAKRLCFLGDSAVDIETALNAGMCALGAAWGFRSRSELEIAGAAAILEEPKEILRWL